MPYRCKRFGRTPEPGAEVSLAMRHRLSPWRTRISHTITDAAYCAGICILRPALCTEGLVNKCSRADISLPGVLLWGGQQLALSLMSSVPRIPACCKAPEQPGPPGIFPTVVRGTQLFPRLPVLLRPFSDSSSD